MRAAEFCEQVRSIEVVRLHVFFTGYVQGVGFRWTMQTFARDEGVTGWVKNLPDRITVEAELQSTGDAVAAVVSRMHAHYQKFNEWFPSGFSVRNYERLEPNPSELGFEVRTPQGRYR